MILLVSDRPTDVIYHEPAIKDIQDFQTALSCGYSFEIRQDLAHISCPRSIETASDRLYPFKSAWMYKGVHSKHFKDMTHKSSPTSFQTSRDPSTDENAFVL